MCALLQDQCCFHTNKLTGSRYGSKTEGTDRDVTTCLFLGMGFLSSSTLAPPLDHSPPPYHPHPYILILSCTCLAYWTQASLNNQAFPYTQTGIMHVEVSGSHCTAETAPPVPECLQEFLLEAVEEL